jgi:serine/threonine-protein kinase
VPDVEGYEVLGEPVCGGMGMVCKARDTRLGRPVALKFLPRENAADAGRLQRFRREALAVSALNHPFICTLYDVGQSGGRPFLVMEWIEGKTLRDLADQRLPLPEVVRLIGQVAQALAAAHAAGIVHRDVKPENIMVRADGFTKLVDFGLARPLPAGLLQPGDAPALTELGTLLGTVRYLSPEQARAEPVGSATDVFSLGIVLYELATGQHPFPAASKLGFLHSIVSQAALPASRLNPEIPGDLENLLRHMLAKEARLRPTAAAVVAALAEVAGSTGGTAGPGSSPATPQPVSRQKVGAQLQPTEARRKRRAGRLRKAVDSLAVLPLFNASDDPDLEYLSDGITESIIRTLSQLPRLRVMARSTVFRFKGREVDACAVGRELNVRAVLTGRVLQRGDQLVLRAELVDTADGAQLWGEQYDRPLADILAIEEEMAWQIVERLRLRLTESQRMRLGKRPTLNTEAYQFYLRGKYHWNQRTEAGFKKAIHCFEQALEKDPTCAVGYAGLAGTYIFLANYHILPAAEAYPMARKAAENALALDETLAEAHIVLADVKSDFDRDWVAAEREFKRGIELNPGDAASRQWYAEFLSGMGRHDEALAQVRQAQVNDPLSPMVGTMAGALLFLARRYDLALDQLRSTIALHPDFHTAHYFLAFVCLQKGMEDQAARALLQQTRLFGASRETVMALQKAYDDTGARGYFLKEVELTQQAAKQGPVNAYKVAVLQAYLGNQDEALDWLAKANEARSALFILHLQTDPLLDDLRADPRFKRLLREVGFPGTEMAGDRPIDSLAILPLVNATADPDLEYLSDGITESLINRLSRLPRLRVMARSTVFRYKGRNLDTQEVGRALNVRAVLTGEVVQRDDRVLIKTELVNVADGAQLWGEHYNRHLAETVALEEAIAQEIAEKLRLRLTGTEKMRLSKRYTENAEAYQLCLKGRYYWNKRTEEGLKKSIQLFQEAIDLDPNYAHAHAGIADAYLNLGGWGHLSCHEGYGRARAAAVRALEIDDTLAEGHASLAMVQKEYDWDWPAAGRSYQRALQLNPNYAVAHLWHGEYLAALGQHPQAIAAIQRALELDPLSLIIQASLGRHGYYFARQYDRAIAQLRQTLEMDEHFWVAHHFLAWTYANVGRLPEALAECEAARRLNDNLEIPTVLGFIHGRAGRRREASQVLDELRQRSPRQYVSPMLGALIAIGMGDHDQAFDWLEKAYADRAQMLSEIKAEPAFDPLRQDPRFAELLRRMNFPPEADALPG